MANKFLEQGTRRDKTTSSEDVYWATEDDVELVSMLEEKIDSYYNYISASGKRSMWAAAYNQYYAALFNGPDINVGGAEGEYSHVSVNQLRNVFKHLMNLTINQRPAFEPRATNTDSKSQKQTIIARSLLTYYLQEKGLEENIRTALELAGLYGEGFVTVTWSPDDGEVIGIDPETGIEVTEGDIEYAVFEPMDVVRDQSLKQARDADWYITRKFVNRWDLVARFPEHRDNILTAPRELDPMRNFKVMNASQTAVNQTDLIEVFEFYHARTAALPKGRYCMFTYGGDALLTSTLPYRNMPVKRLSADDIGGQPFGYGTVFDLLPVQQAIDTAYSTIQTNQDTFGVQSITVPKGSNLTTSQVSNGLNLIEYVAGPTGGKPEAINFTATAPETFNHLNKLERTMEQLSGINSVIRGEPPSAGMSGSAMALLQAQAVQFVQGLQASYIKLLESIGTDTIATLRDYATTKRVVAIVGKSQRSNLEEFSGDDLSTINRVQVDVGNPLARTVAGRLQIAQDLLANKMIKNPIEYISVIETGNVETMMEGPMNELLCIKAENEAMTEGEQVQAMILDNHQLHISEHAAIIADPAVRRDPARLAAAMNHIQQHWGLWSDPANAGIIQATGQALPPQAAPQGGANVSPPGAPTDPAALGAESANVLAAGMQPNMPAEQTLPPGAIPIPGGPPPAGA